jgi:hypothetical protein
MKTLRTRPTWSGAPEIPVLLVSRSRPEQEASRAVGSLMKVGALEPWIISPTGKIGRYLKEGRRFLIQTPLETVDDL